MDWWALGVLMYEMMAGQVSWDSQELCLQCLWAHTRDFSLTVVVKFYFSLATRGFRWPFSRFLLFFLEIRWLWGKSSFCPKLLLARPLVDVQFLNKMYSKIQNAPFEECQKMTRYSDMMNVCPEMNVWSRVLEAGACNRPNCFAFYSLLLKLTMKMTCLSLSSMMMCFILFGLPRKLSPYWKG